MNDNYIKKLYYSLSDKFLGFSNLLVRLLCETENEKSQDRSQKKFKFLVIILIPLFSSLVFWGFSSIVFRLSTLLKVKIVNWFPRIGPQIQNIVMYSIGLLIGIGFYLFTTRKEKKERHLLLIAWYGFFGGFFWAIGDLSSEAVPKLALFTIQNVVTPDVCFWFSSITVFTTIYKLMVIKLEQSLSFWGETFVKNANSIQEIISSIYIENPSTKRVYLAEKWRSFQLLMSNGIALLVAFMLMVTRCGFSSESAISDSFLKSKNNLKVSLFFFCFMFILEIVHYLNLDTTPEKSDFKTNITNFTKLRLDFQHYSRLYEIPMSPVYRNRETQRHHNSVYAEDSYFDTENELHSYLKSYLGEHNQVEHMELGVQLLEGNNAFYASSFYKDIDACIAFVMFFTLLRNQKGLILIEDNGELQKVRQWLQDSIDDICGSKHVWNVDILQHNGKGVDIGILSFQEICANHQVNNLPDFLEDVGFALVIQATDMLVGGQETIRSLVEKINVDNKKCTWLLCDWNAEYIRDVFSHLFGSKFEYICATPISAAETEIDYWNIEKEPDIIWTESKSYLGLETGLIEIAAKNQIEKVILYGEENMPVRDLRTLIQVLYILYGKHVGKILSQAEVNVKIVERIFGISYDVEERQFMIVGDYNYNLYEVARQFSTRGRKQAYVHILSPDYLLRDFIKSEDPEYDPKYIAQFAPEYVNSERNAWIYLIRKLIYEELSEVEGWELLDLCDKNESGSKPNHERQPFSFRDLLLENINNLLNLKISLSQVQVRVSVGTDKRTGKVIQNRTYFVNNRDVRNSFEKYFRQVCYVDETGEERFISHMMLGEHLPYKYLPGQYVILDGKYYYVEKLWEKSPDKLLLVVKRKTDGLLYRKFYRQIRKFTIPVYEFLNKSNATSCKFDKFNIKVESRWISWESEIKGYFVLEKGMNRHPNNPENRIDLQTWYGEDYVNSPMRASYHKKKTLFIDLSKFISSKEEEAIYRFAMILHEMFYTLYPKFYHLLSVSVYLGGKDCNPDLQKQYEGSVSSLEIDTTRVNDNDQNNKTEPILKRNDGMDNSYNLPEGPDEIQEETALQNSPTGQTEQSAISDHKVQLPEEIGLYIFEDSGEDMGLLMSIENNFERILRLVSRYSLWENENDPVTGQPREKYYSQR